MAKRIKPGAPLLPQDEGEGVNIAVFGHKAKVRIEFGKRIGWLTMTPDAARNLADLLYRKATQIEEDTEPK